MVTSLLSPKECPSCNHKKIDLYSDSLSVWKCLSCGLLFRDISNNNQGKFIQLYENAWLNSAENEGQTGGTSLKLARIYLQRLSAYLGLKSLKGLKILDFGAGTGKMLTALAELGADAYGIDPFGYEFLKNKGFKVFRSIEDVPEGISFDGVIAIDVIEHLFRPNDSIRDIYGLLSPGGWFYIATPNVDSLNARLLKTHWREFYNPSHTYFFTSRSIARVFTGLNIFRFKRLYWFIKYRDNPFQKPVHFLLQYFQLDGELRYVLRKAALRQDKKSGEAGRIGVVLINWNGAKFTTSCISSLLSGTRPPDRIIVVDNASTDGSDKEIVSIFKDVQLIKNESNIGFAAANNLGIQELINQGGYKYIWVLNNDTEVTPDCLERQYEFLENNPEISGCCCKILYSYSRDIIWYAGAKLDRFTLRVRHKGILEVDSGKNDLPEEITFMTGCSMFVRRQVWQEAGTFDGKFFVYYEDLDWCLRAEKKNFKFWYYPRTIVYHKVSAAFGNKSGKQSPWVTPPRVAYLVQRNQVFIIRRWKSRLSFLFILFSLEAPRLLYYSIGLIFLKRFDNLSALWKGTRDGLFSRIDKINHLKI